MTTHLNRYNHAQNFVTPATIEARPTVAELLPPEPAPLSCTRAACGMSSSASSNTGTPPTGTP